MIARNWYSVLNASIARVFPEKSSSARGVAETMSERLIPIRRSDGPWPVKALLHLGLAHREEEPVVAELGLDDVRVLRCEGDELHVERGRRRGSCPCAPP